VSQPAGGPTTPAGAPDAPGLVFLHGFLGAGSDWLPIARAFEERFSIRCLDLPGHGEHNLDEAPEHLTAFLQPQCQHCAIVGYSMGARLALQFAIEHPRSVSRLVLESVHPGIADPRQREERLKHDLALAETLRSLPDDDAMAAWLRDWYAAPLWESLQERPELLEQLIQKRRAQHRRSLAWGLEALSIGRQENLWPRLGELSMPTLVIAGEQDHKYADIAQRMSELNPRIAVMIVSGCGHNVHLEAPDTYTRVLQSFLAA
jgi:2-succinyl-6-hydroxy-2,4-cyclohexadiene-1-carboxylate synthase